jgi:hypothetical protein
MKTTMKSLTSIYDLEQMVQLKAEIASLKAATLGTPSRNIYLSKIT